MLRPFRFSPLVTRWILPLVAILFALQADRDGNPLGAQENVDVVVLRRPDRPGETMERKGFIRSWRGDELELETGDSTRKIDGNDIVQVRTVWPEGYEEAMQRIRQRDFAGALAPLSAAIDAETRPWASAILREQYLTLLEYSGDVRGAAEQFLQILSADSATRHFPSIPLAWDNSATPAGIAPLATRWIQSPVPTIRLLGASWLVGSPDREKALATLQELSRDLEPRIAFLATAQVWRSEWVTADASAVERWAGTIQRMPAPLRPGPLMMLGAARRRLGQTDKALLCLLQVPILHSARLRLARAGLQQAAEWMESEGRQSDANRLRAELARDFGGVP